MSITSVKTAIAPEEEERPSKPLTYFLATCHTLSSILTLVLIALIISNGVVYKDTTDLRDMISKGIYPECKEIKIAAEINIAILTIVGATSLFTSIVATCHNSKTSRPFFSILVSGVFSLAVLTLFLWNILATTYVGKLEARVCRDLPGVYPSNELYYMALANVIVIWCAIGLPLVAAFTIWIRYQVSSLRQMFAPILPLHASPHHNPLQQQADFLLPQRAFRYP